MQITLFTVNMLQENCYLVWDEASCEAALIDCGAFRDEEKQTISDYLSNNKLTLTHLFNTHAHFDHLFGAEYIYKGYGVGVELSEEERDTYAAARKQMLSLLRVDLPLETPPVARYFHDGDVLTVGNVMLTVIATPGHTPGGVCFYAEKERVLFSGDSLFRRQIGRCDFPGGSEISLINALRTRVLALPDDVQVLPGHGEPTTVGEERALNAYLQ